MEGVVAKRGNNSKSGSKTNRSIAILQVRRSAVLKLEEVRSELQWLKTEFKKLVIWFTEMKESGREVMYFSSSELFGCLEISFSCVLRLKIEDQCTRGGTQRWSYAEDLDSVGWENRTQRHGAPYL